MTDDKWIDVGASAELASKPVQEIRVGSKRIALTHKGGEFGAISGVCNHVGGPLGRGHLEGEFVVCPMALLQVPLANRRRRARL